ncbi:hypothetical protein D3C79_846290 [compost metagenome]
METIVELVVVFGGAQRREQRILVIAHTVGGIEQLGVFLHVVVDMDTGKTDADVILRTRIERAFVDKHQRLVVVDEVGVLVMEGGVCRDVQATAGIAVMAGELLLRDKPVAMLAVMHAITVTRGRRILTVVILTHIIGVGRTLVVTHTVFARQAVDFR